MLYSRTTNGFYHSEIHGNSVPPDVVEITDAEHAELLVAQSSGKRIQPDGSGRPVALDPAPPTLSQVKAQKMIELRQARESASVANVTVHGKVFSADPNIQTAFKRLADRMRRGKPSKLQAIMDVDGNPVTQVTQALLDGIEDAIADNTENAWNKYGALAGQVQAATTNAQVEAIVW